MTRRSVQTVITAVLSGIVLLAFGDIASSQPRAPQGPPAGQNRGQRADRSRVIVELKLPSPQTPEGNLPDVAAVASQRQAIASRITQALAKLPPGSHRVVHQFLTTPFVALEATAEARAALALDPDVARVLDDELLFPVLRESVPLIEGDQSWAAGYDGTGTVVAVLDTGVDKTHPFLAGKVVEEACYSSAVAGVSETLCPSGTSPQIGVGAAVPCPLSDCLHGTHVAGIVAGSDDTVTPPIAGVAKGAHLFAIQVFTKVIDPQSCAVSAPCIGAFTSDVIAGLERVYTVALTGQYTIASVNMSLGGKVFTSPCDSEPYKPAIDNLRAIGIATVIAAGNSGIPFGISTPGCVSTAVSVGSTNKDDVISYFSNVASFLSLLAPGESITSSVPGGTYTALSGTSMATPHVAGSWAVLRQAAPTASVSTILARLRNTGLMIHDDRFLGSATVPRVRLFRALASLVSVTNPSPSISGTNPTRAKAGSGPLALTINGAGFSSFTVARWNGADRPTRVVSMTSLKVSIPASDLAAEGTAHISVFTPTPGGGTSVALDFTIDPPPTLTVSTSIVAPDSQATATLSQGYGGAGDYLVLAKTGAADNSYLQWTYVGSGVTSRTWTVTMPSTAGTYEFRLFVNDVKKATSPPVTVDPSVNPTPVTNYLSPATAMTGTGAFTLTVSGSKFIASSVVRWNGIDRPTTFVSANELRAAIGASDIAAVADVQVTVFTPAPGGGASLPLVFSVRQGPTFAVSPTNVQSGSSVTLTLTNAPGGYGDWLAWAATTDANTSYLTYTYVGTGVTTRTWTVTAPAPGTYEFRLFTNNTYTRIGTSPTVTVVPGPPFISSLSPASTTAGSAAFTLTVNGGGFDQNSVVRWNGVDRATTFVNATQVRAAILASDVTTQGTAQITVFTPATGSSTATAFPINGPPVLTVNTTSIAAGSSVTVTLTGGLGGAADWLAIASTSAPENQYLEYTYVGANVTTRTWTVMIPVGGTYEFRLFINNSYTRVATSAPVTVAEGPSPVLTVSATTAAPGTPVTVTLVNGRGGATDWLGFALSSAPNTSYLYWSYIGAYVTTKTWTVTMPSTPGVYEFRLFLNNGFTRIATSPPITVQ